MQSSQHLGLKVWKVIRDNHLKPDCGECSCLESKTAKLTEKGSYFSYANYPLIIFKLGQNLIGDDHTNPNFTINQSMMFMKIGQPIIKSSHFADKCLVL
jgi:hypothetical protein